MEQANFSCGNFKPEISESEYLNMPLAKSNFVNAPRIASAGFAMECKLMDIYELKGEKGDVTTNVVIGKVVGYHVKNAVYDKQSNRILLDKYKPVGRLGGVGELKGRRIGTPSLPRGLTRSPRSSTHRVHPRQPNL